MLVCFHRHNVTALTKHRCAYIIAAKPDWCDTGDEDAHQAMQALAQMSAQANGYTPMFPAGHNMQMQQSMAMWQPYLALLQMQSFMAGGMGGPLGGSMGPIQEQAMAQQAQQALMLAAQQMGSNSSPMALPQSLGIAMGAAPRMPQGPQQSRPLASGLAIQSQGIV